MKIRKPHNIILFKKYPAEYFDWNTFINFPYDQINKHPQWYKREYNNNGNQISYEDYCGDWQKWEYDNNEKLIYTENSDGYWAKTEYDQWGNEIYWENCYGIIIDNRR